MLVLQHWVDIAAYVKEDLILDWHVNMLAFQPCVGIAAHVKEMTSDAELEEVQWLWDERTAVNQKC